MDHILKVLVLFFFLISCSKQKKESFKKVNYNGSSVKKIKLTNTDLKNWHFKDIELDTLVGISLNRSYDSLLSNRKGEEIIVAVMDMAIEVNHKSLKGFVWQNKDEIVNNIDDDNNGYVDDVNGWNFIGEGGLGNEFVNYEYTRILKKYNSLFRNKTLNEISHKDSLMFSIYKNALKKHSNRTEFAEKDLDYINMVIKGKNQAEEELSKYFNDRKYGLKDLDSIRKVYPDNKLLQKMAKRKSNFLKWGYTDEYVSFYKLNAEERKKKLLNLDYNDRQIQGDNPDNLDDIKYGSGSFSNNTSLLDHGTKIAGIIINIGKKREIKLMPLEISAYGDEHDKDIALAIRYAVDNGAKVINMSFAKEFSLYPKWVLEAIEYAEKKDVLIVHAAANDNKDLDEMNTYLFPNDHGYENNTEVANNFLTIGGSGLYTNSSLKSPVSNYGKTEVDLFAPSEYVYTTFPNDKHDIARQGTSIACAITSGVAALIRSYYPDLSAPQVKSILMDSGLEFNINVNKGTRKDTIMVPFNSLSKSGRILNTYNALIMAEQILRN